MNEKFARLLLRALPWNALLSCVITTQVEAGGSYHRDVACRGKLMKLGGVAAAKHRLAINNGVPAPMSERHKLSGDGRGIDDMRSIEHDATCRADPQMAVSVRHSEFRWSHRSSHSHDGSCPVRGGRLHEMLL